jgi:hypothetical protein
VGVRVLGVLLTDENADHLQTFIAKFQMLDFGSLQYSFLRDHLVQPAIVDMIRHHVSGLLGC